MFGFESGKPLVVVEIGNEWLKIAESRPAAGRCITKAKFVRLSEIKGPLHEAIAKIFKNLRLNKHAVIMYIPRHLVNVRILELPSIDPQEIKDIVNLQMGKQTPYSKDEIVSSYSIIDTSREGYIKIMLVIARRNIVTERLEALEKNGIELERVALSSEGVYNWFKIAYMPGVKEDYSETVALVDIDSNYSDFIIVRGRKMVFSRNIFIGANNILETQSNWQEKFIEEISRSVERYRSEEKNVKLSRIFLSGAARMIKGLDQVLSAKLDIPTETTDPFKNIVIKKNVGVLPDEDSRAISVSPLFGIALMPKALEFDLMPQEARIYRLMEARRKALTVMGILFAAIAMMASSFLLAGIYNKTSYLGRLKKEISRVGKNADEARKMRVRISLVEKRLDAKGTSLDILNEVHKLIPKEIYFTSINIEEKKQAILKGRASAMSDVFRFVTTLENSPYFKNAKTTYTTTKKEEDKEYADFEIICMYEK